MKTHPFKPLIPKEANKLIIGTLPPETAPFYFSNSKNTRLWDILRTIQSNETTLFNGSNEINEIAKIDILRSLKIGISDIILDYEREDYNSVQDKDIIPLKYNNLIKIAEKNSIEEFIFVYKSAYKWFLHSLFNVEPVKLEKLKGKYEIGLVNEIQLKDKILKCYLLPSPLNRGSKGQTLEYKLEKYSEFILK